MNCPYNIFVATGLGKAAGDLFVSGLRSQLDQQFPLGRLFARCVDVCDIVPILRDGRRVSGILLKALLSCRYQLPNLVLIPCNSVHIATPYLKHAFGDRFVPINEAVMSSIDREGRRGRFLILGTTTTLEAGFYQEGLSHLGCEALTLPSDAQAMLDDLIFRELVRGKMNLGHLRTLRQVEINFMHRLNADHVILACTELCYLVRVFSQPKSYEIDSLQALHDAGLSRLHYLMEGGLSHATRYSHVVG